ncbi:glycosyltransferase [Tardisphaera miroshnichenkoae]
MKHPSLVVSASKIRGGLGVYSKRLYSLGLFDSLALFKNNITVSDEGYDRVVKPPIPFRPFYTFHVLYSFHFKSRWSEALKGFSLVHFSSPDWFHLASNKNECYGTVHDLFPITMPSSYPAYYRRFFSREMEALTKLKKVVVPSAWVRQKVEELYPDSDVVVVHHWTGDEFRPRDKQEARKRLGLPLDKRLVLSVGTEEPRKNVAFLAKVMKELGESYALARIGPASSLSGIPVMAVKDVPEELIPLYYNAADVLVAPSIDEGFDYPVIEAINSGTAVVASDIAVHEEIMRGEGKLVPLGDAKAWAEAVKEACDEGGKWSLGDYYRQGRARKEHEALYA